MFLNYVNLTPWVPKWSKMLRFSFNYFSRVLGSPAFDSAPSCLSKATLKIFTLWRSNALFNAKFLKIFWQFRSRVEFCALQRGADSLTQIQFNPNPV